MAPFVPPDSLSRRYAQAYRRVTWKKVRTSKGVKVLPPIPTQFGPTCLYVSLMAWLESHLRLQGIVIRLSSKDLEEKEQALMTEEEDRTARCFEVLASMGVRSEFDYENEIWDGIMCYVTACERFFSLNEQAIRGALQSMERGLLLLVFNCDKTYKLYLTKYQSKPILSYEKYKHEEIESHAANAVGYCIENIVPASVPAWDFMNTYGKSGPRKGFGRVLAQNAVRLVGLKKLRVVYPRGKINQKRKGEYRDDEEETKRRLKKQRLENHVELAGEDQGELAGEDQGDLMKWPGELAGEDHGDLMNWIFQVDPGFFGESDV